MYTQAEVIRIYKFDIFRYRNG